MKITVQFFAQLRDLAGTPKLDVDLAERSTITQLLEKIYAEKPALRAQDKSTLVGVGVEFVHRNYVIQSGDEISIMPPVQGG
jgi:molybdopterin converting factor small subunit